MTDKGKQFEANGTVTEEDPNLRSPRLSESQAKEEVTRLIEKFAQAGLSSEQVSDILEERSTATPYLYEGMNRYIPQENPKPENQNDD